MLKITFIACGGAFGSVLRYLVSTNIQKASSLTSFPIGTLVANVSGCFLIGLLATLLTGNGPFIIREEYRLGLLVGLLGGYTTFSTFSYESITLMQSGQYRITLLNIVLSNVFGLLAAWLGNRVAVSIWSA